MAGLARIEMRGNAWVNCRPCADFTRVWTIAFRCELNLPINPPGHELSCVLLQAGNPSTLSDAWESCHEIIT